MVKKLSTLELLKRINEKFPNKFDLTEYLDKQIEYRTKIHVKCNDCGYEFDTTAGLLLQSKHGEFELSPEKHLRGHGCQICNRSKGEVLVAKILTDLKISYKEQQRINVDNNVVIVDFVANGKYVEYNGKLHYEPIEYFGGNERFVLLQNRDESLRKYCKENDILLLEISCKLKPDEVKDLIQKFYEI